jgi:hypothetical protein
MSPNAETLVAVFASVAPDAAGVGVLEHALSEIVIAARAATAAIVRLLNNFPPLSHAAACAVSRQWGP